MTYTIEIRKNLIQTKGFKALLIARQYVSTPIERSLRYYCLLTARNVIPCFSKGKRGAPEYNGADLSSTSRLNDLGGFHLVEGRLPLGSGMNRISGGYSRESRE